jgi:hypothetical protein
MVDGYGARLAHTVGLNTLGAKRSSINRYPANV